MLAIGEGQEDLDNSKNALVELAYQRAEGNVDGEYFTLASQARDFADNLGRRTDTKMNNKLKSKLAFASFERATNHVKVGDFGLASPTFDFGLETAGKSNTSGLASSLIEASLESAEIHHGNGYNDLARQALDFAEEVTQKSGVNTYSARIDSLKLQIN